jgi:hypothetical protein
VYRFSALLEGRVWTVDLPCWKGDPHYEKHHLSDEERQRILPRIVKFLSKVKWFGFLEMSYSVRVRELPEK